MHCLQTLDVELFRFINLRLINPVFDAVMPFFSGNAFFPPALLVAAVLLVCKGGARGRLCVLAVALALAFGEPLVWNAMKHAVGRPRPFLVLPEVHCLVGKTHSGSMPSSHAANWFAATVVTFVYYRRSLWFMLPVASLVGFSRIYNGVHYPSDVLVGAILGAGCAAATVWLLNTLWRWAGQKWFPLWWEKLPSLVVLSPPASPGGAGEGEGERPLHPSHRAVDEVRQSVAADVSRRTLSGERLAPTHVGGYFVNRPDLLGATPHVELDQHWLRLGYLCIAVLLLARLAYLASGTIQLVEDEAYQWLWSKHLALSYYSKPPLIAYTQFIGTSLWGDTAFGVRFFSPVIAAILALVMLRFFAREVNARAGFFLLLILTATPLMAVGSILMTVDPLSVLFWTAAMLAGWRAVQDDGRTSHWLWAGLWMGLGFLSKYTELFQWLCWAVFFALWPPARKHLRRPGPYLALLINLLCALPVLVWNGQHHWITLQHLADNAGLRSKWEPTLKYLGDFLGIEAGLLNPIFFIGMIWAAVAFWRRGRHNPRLLYFFSMGAPLFVAYLLQTLRSRVFPNWIAPSVLPLFCLMVIYWDTRWRLGVAQIKAWFVAGLVLGFTVVILGHNTDLLGKLTGHLLPVNYDALHRARQWDQVARVAGQARQELLAEGKPVFIIADHYGMVGQISFHLPEAKANVSGTPLVYYRTSQFPQNQFFFWPGYTNRHGENAVYFRELDRDDPRPLPAPPQLLKEFDSVTDMGVRNALYHGRLLRPLQFFACRGLK